MPVVVGIFPNYSGITKLTDEIKAAGLDLAQLVVIADEAPGDTLISGGVQFKLTGEPDEELLTSPRGIITSSGGTEVPGLVGTSMPSIVGDTNTQELLAEMGVPEARSEDYELALEAGRCVAGYPTTGDAEQLKASFVAAGALATEVF